MEIFADKKGQSSLEITAVFIAVVVLVGAITGIWVWENKQIVERQKKYNESRLSAGTASENYSLKWPVYHPEELKESDVFSAQQ